MKKLFEDVYVVLVCMAVIAFGALIVGTMFGLFVRLYKASYTFWS